MNPLLQTRQQFQTVMKDFYKMVQSASEAENILEEMIEREIDILVVDNR